MEQSSTTTTATVAATPGSPAAVLTRARAARATEQAAAAQLLGAAVDWASMHEPVGEGTEASWWIDGRFVPLAGEGTPPIAEYAVTELAAVVGLSTDAGRALIGHALELAHRLPRIWAAVQAGTVPAWRARRIAEATTALAPDAAAFVDTHLAAVAGRVSWAQLDRLVTEARHRHAGTHPDCPVDTDPGPDRRHVTIRTDQVSFDGTVQVAAEVDLGDALDLEAAVRAGAAQLKAAGSTETLDARRASALGELARSQHALDYPTAVGDSPTSRTTPARRPVTLFLHLSAAAVSGAAGGVGRCGNTRTPLDAETIRAWCGNGDLTIKPVVDLAGHVRVDAYEIPDRINEQVDLRDGSCVFPWCTRPAWGCDHDHATPYQRDGTTCTCNIAALCRHHHRLKTHTAWRYRIIEPGTYLWHSPHGYVLLRDHTGTTDVTPAGLTALPGCPGPGPSG